MKLLKKILFLIIALIALVLIVAIFVEDEYAVTKSVVVDLPSDDVFDYVKSLDNQEEYGVWLKKDPKVKITRKGTDGDVGYVMTWESSNEEVGKGEQEIVKIEDGKRIDFKLRFKEPFEAEDDAFITTESLGEYKTKVTWGFKGKMSYPMNIMMLFMDMEGMLGPALEEGLVNLKKTLETSDSE